MHDTAVKASNVKSFKHESEAVLAVVTELRITISHREQVIEHLSDANKTLSDELITTKEQLASCMNQLAKVTHEYGTLSKSLDTVVQGSEDILRRIK